MLAGFGIYIFLRSLSKKISPKLKKKENLILKKLERIDEEENVLKAKKNLLRKQIDDIIEQGMELKRIEQGIEIKKQAIISERKETKIEKNGGNKGEKTEKDIQQFLKIIDNWLGKLPEKTIDEFSKSKDFELYKSILKRYGLK